MFQSTRPHGARSKINYPGWVWWGFNPRAHTGRDFIRRLRDAGFEEDKAEAVAEAFQEAQAESLPVTRDYLDARLYEMENRMVKWGIGLALGQFAMIAALIKLL